MRKLIATLICPFLLGFGNALAQGVEVRLEGKTLTGSSGGKVVWRRTLVMASPKLAQVSGPNAWVFDYDPGYRLLVFGINSRLENNYGFGNQLILLNNPDRDVRLQGERLFDPVTRRIIGMLPQGLVLADSYAFKLEDRWFVLVRSERVRVRFQAFSTASGLPTGNGQIDFSQDNVRWASEPVRVYPSPDGVYSLEGKSVRLQTPPGRTLVSSSLAHKPTGLGFAGDVLLATTSLPDSPNKPPETHIAALRRKDLQLIWQDRFEMGEPTELQRVGRVILATTVYGGAVTSAVTTALDAKTGKRFGSVGAHRKQFGDLLVSDFAVGYPHTRDDEAAEAELSILNLTTGENRTLKIPVSPRSGCGELKNSDLGQVKNRVGEQHVTVIREDRCGVFELKVRWR